MAWAVYSHANFGSVTRTRPFGVCDRCGFVYNRDNLRWQYDWAGLKEFSKGILVCPTCMDIPQSQLKTLVLPADPVPILNPRPGEFGGMVISSSPDPFATVVPSQLVVQHSTGNTTTEIGNRSAIVTETSSEPLLTEVTVTPYPDPNAGDGGYTRMPGAST